MDDALIDAWKDAEAAIEAAMKLAAYADPPAPAIVSGLVAVARSILVVAQEVARWTP